LTADFADIYNPGYGTHAVLEGTGNKSVIKNWVDPRVRLEWMINATEPGTYKIEGLIKTNQDCKLDIAVDDQKITSEIQATGDKFDVVSLGEIQINDTGNKLVGITPDKEIWGEVELIYVELIKK